MKRYIFLVLLSSAAFGGIPQSGKLIKNLDWKLQGDQIVITYDIITGTDNQFKVNVLMLNEDDPDVHITPRAVHGDVGIVPFGGRGKKIVWDFRQDLDFGLEGAKYYFQITASRIDDSNPWTYIAVGGGVAVAGGVAALLLLHHGTDTPGGGGGIPSPPDRP